MDEDRLARPRTVAEKLSRLFEVMHAPEARPLSTREVAKRVKQQGGSISPTYISELRTGKKTNPSLEQVMWLAAAFGVSAGYFTDPEVAERVDAELDRLAERHRNAQLQELAAQTACIAERTASLSPTDREALAAMVEQHLKSRREQQAL
ncbi:helix-turn-helix domain-containing protein [Pseudonocardia kujensis]|uniref:helix-turn-helix domain-containing protein n=1 Tax=Pseudonocardia kujensis TaxID=1128675 RepID=UPI001E507FFC|nr:helix-turn-helix domain-containing protein [Pseudonocardia kujensis]MCE0764136.1 helix-turn-helix domain-containing protein [Pseudonocardia kujensis]